MVERKRTMKIQIDAKACCNPLDCRLCLERCPEQVFGTYPRVRRMPGATPGNWAIIPMFASNCNGCLECIAFCPQQAITVQPQSYRQEAKAALALFRDVVLDALSGHRTKWSWKK